MVVVVVSPSEVNRLCLPTAEGKFAFQREIDHIPDSQSPLR